MGPASAETGVQFLRRDRSDGRRGFLFQAFGKEAGDQANTAPFASRRKMVTVSTPAPRSRSSELSPRSFGRKAEAARISSVIVSALRSFIVLSIMKRTDRSCVDRPGGVSTR